MIRFMLADYPTGFDAAPCDASILDTAIEAARTRARASGLTVSVIDGSMAPARLRGAHDGKVWRAAVECQKCRATGTVKVPTGESPCGGCKGAGWRVPC